MLLQMNSGSSGLPQSQMSRVKAGDGSLLRFKNNSSLDIVAVNTTYNSLLNTLLPDPKTCPPPSCIIIHSGKPSSTLKQWWWGAKQEVKKRPEGLSHTHTLTPHHHHHHLTKSLCTMRLCPGSCPGFGTVMGRVTLLRLTPALHVGCCYHYCSVPPPNHHPRAGGPNCRRNRRALERLWTWRTAVRVRGCWGPHGPWRIPLHQPARRYNSFSSVLAAPPHNWLLCRGSSVPHSCNRTFVSHNVNKTNTKVTLQHVLATFDSKVKADKQTSSDH